MRLPIKILLSILIVVIVTFVSGFVYLKNNPPLDAVFTGSSSEKGIILVEVGNKSSLAEIWVEEVLVNNSSRPLKVKIQESDPLKGFIISSNFEGEEEKQYNFKDLKSVSIHTNTARQKQLDKFRDRTASEKDIIYAITISHEESIQQVIIKYRFLGLTYTKVIQTQ